jgi:hypothetical protein
VAPVTAADPLELDERGSPGPHGRDPGLRVDRHGW